jgi:hypothetical protein
MELDGNANYKMQQMVYSEKGNHVLSFRWAAREGKYSTSAMSIYWNGTKVFTHAPTAVAEYSIHYESIPIVVA